MKWPNFSLPKNGTKSYDVTTELKSSPCWTLISLFCKITIWEVNRLCYSSLTFFIFFFKLDASILQWLFHVNVSVPARASSFQSEAWLHHTSNAPFIWRTPTPSRKVSIPTESTLASVYMRHKLTPLPEPTLLVLVLCLKQRSRILIVSLWLGEPKCLYGEKLVRLGGCPYHPARQVTVLTEPTFCFSCKQFAIFFRICMKGEHG